MTYRAPVPDYEFMLRHIVGFDRVAETERPQEQPDHRRHRQRR